MKSTMGLLLGLGLMWAAVAVADESCTKKSLGAGVKIAESTAIGAITAKPDDYVGKAVRIEGEVIAVCAMRGCWLELAADDGEELRVEVEDGVIVFPISSKGKRAVAEGVVEAVEQSRAEYLAAKQHAAHEGGKAVDEATIGEGPFRALHLKGTGAEVCVD